jgi:SAM-dependent methyltransferase
VKETSKAMRRRQKSVDPVDWKSVFVGRGLDVGPGDDPLLPGWFPGIGEVVFFDKQHGDANRLSAYFPPESFDFIHSSQSLEHMFDPTACVKDWLTLLKKGGWLICTVPSWELYEGMIWPSRFNWDHKSTWSLSLNGSPAPIHIHVPKWLAKLRDTDRVIQEYHYQLCDGGYNYRVGPGLDQTIPPNGAEAFIEFVMRR